MLNKLLHSTIRRHTALTLGGLQKQFCTHTPDLYRRVRVAGGEREQMEEFIRHVRPGDVVWDVGAFLGMYSLFAAGAATDSGKVYSFEPEPRTLELLTKNIGLNRASNIVVIRAALTDKDQPGYIYPAKASQNAIHSLRPGDRLEPDGVPTTLCTGDVLVKQGAALAPNVIKMDIEGAEILALRGMAGVLGRRDCRYLFIEVHPKELPKFGAAANEVVALITNAGFRLEKSWERGDEVHMGFARAA